MSGASNTHTGVEKCIQNFSWKLERSGRLSRPKRRWEDSIKTNLREIGCNSVDLIQITQSRLRNILVPAR
jgi:hypothetical protein